MGQLRRAYTNYFLALIRLNFFNHAFSSLNNFNYTDANLNHTSSIFSMDFDFALAGVKSIKPLDVFLCLFCLSLPPLIFFYFAFCALPLEGIHYAVGNLLASSWSLRPTDGCCYFSFSLSLTLATKKKKKKNQKTNHNVMDRLSLGSRAKTMAKTNKTKQQKHIK